MSASRDLALVTPEVERVMTINQRYAYVLVGGQQAVLAERDDGDFDLWTLAAFRGWFANQEPVLVPGARGERPVPVADYWLRHPLRRSYERIVFHPDPAKVRPGDYNLWRGFAVEPSNSGSCERFLAHLRENVAQGNPEHARWILGWLADLVQRPAYKPGTSLVLRGPQGVGKTMVGEAMRLLLARHYVPVATSGRIVGHFNAHLKWALLLHADEAFWAGTGPLRAR